MTMISRRAWLAGALALAVAAAVVRAQTAQAPARDATRAPTGTASVSGTVTTDEPSPRPLRQVRVALQSADLRAPIAAVTDDAGRFLLQGVVAGHYTVIASRPGYVDTILGAESGSFFGAPIAVADGEQVTGLSIRLPRGAVITGTVRFPGGRPAPGIQVQVSQVKSVDGKRRTRFLTGLGLVMATTDDRGVYRQFGLAPGDYVVQLGVVGGPPGQSQAQRQTTSNEASWGDRMAASAGDAWTTPPPVGRVEAFAPVYYPGTTDIDRAQVITIAAGEERDGIDVTVEFVPTARLTGRVFDVDGQPRAGVTVRLNGKVGSSLMDMVGALIGRGGRTDADGAYVVEAVPPGEYTITVQAAPAGDTSKPPAADAQANIMTMVSGMFGGGNSAGSLYAVEPVVVAGQDISNLDLRLRPGVTMSGTVVFDGSADRPKGAMQVTVVPVAGNTSTVGLALTMFQGANAPVGPDLTFSVKGIMPNRYRASINLPGVMFGQAMPNATWVLRSVRVGDGPDLADTPFAIETGRDITGVTITLTDKPIVLSGKVLDAQGRPSSAFPILVFSTNPAHWVPGSRRVQQVRPASDGSYRLPGLPAGEYYVGAVTTLDLEDLFDPLFLTQVVPLAFRITLAEGETRQQDLKLGGR
jgi:5-hydroxyisourate hydrolase-like protein (transthyretin family)